MCGALNQWSCTQKAVALTSAEADLYTLNRPAAEALGIHSVAADCGIERRVVLHTDASVAIGTMQRRAGGKFKHIVVQEFGFQGMVQSDRAEFREVGWDGNPADFSRPSM